MAAIPIFYNLRSLGVRRATTLATALGVAVVVFLFAGVQMFGAGLHSVLGRAGSPSVAVIMATGASHELESVFDERHVSLVASQPGVAKTAAAGASDLRADVVGSLRLDLREGGSANVIVRGTGAHDLDIIDGRAPDPGSDEAVVGRAIAGRFAELSVGDTLALPNGVNLKIVGVFALDRSSTESEVWTHADAMKRAYAMRGRVSVVRVRLTSPEALDDLRAALSEQKELGLHAQRESVYYRRQSRGLGSLVQLVAFVVVFFFSIGAMLGATITMHASVAQRRREIGLLSAIGFKRLPILISFLIESTLVAAVGGLIGAAAALGLTGVELGFYNPASSSLLVFPFEAAPTTIAGAATVAIIIGAVGGLFPALKASRTDPISAMRS